MKKLGGFILATAFVACGELRSAQPTADAGVSPKSEDSGAATLDAGKTTGNDDASKGRPPCPAPCQPEQLATIPDLGALVIDSFNAYFAVATGGVYRCAKSGCKVGEPLKLGSGKTTRLAVASSRVFWGEEDHLVACATAGCSGLPEGIASDQVGISEVTTDGTKIVWEAHVGADEVLRSCPAQACVQNNVKDIVVGTALRAGIGVGAGRVFWTDLPQQLRYCPLDPLPCTNVKGLGPGSNDPVVSGDTVYWVLDQAIVRCPLAGCDGVPTKVGTSTSPHLPVIDEYDIYWREMVDNAIVRCPLAGCTGKPEVVVSDVDGTYYGGLVLDGDYFYWTSKDGLWRRHK